MAQPDILADRLPVDPPFPGEPPPGPPRAPRPAHPLSTKVKMECCRLTFSWFIAWLCGLDRSQRNAHLTWLVLNLHSALHWPVFTARCQECPSISRLHDAIGMV